VARREVDAMAAGLKGESKEGSTGALRAELAAARKVGSWAAAALAVAAMAEATAEALAEALAEAKAAPRVEYSEECAVA
jgi:hypothetical protein